MNSSCILELDSITKSYVRNIVNVRGELQDERFYIIDDLDLDVPKGKITALIGGNGAGKTTLFNIISGLLMTDSGNISYQAGILPKSIIGLQNYQIARLGIGRMFQDNHIFQEMTVLDNMLVADSDNFGEIPFVSLFKKSKSFKAEKRRTDKACEIFNQLFGSYKDLWDKRDYLAKDLSYGQQRLLGLARLFMGKYDLVLLDEPTAGVNPAIIENIKQVINKMVSEKNMSVFLIEHNMKVVLDLANFCSFMSHGKITAFGTPDDVIGDVEVRKTYLGI